MNRCAIVLFLMLNSIGYLQAMSDSVTDVVLVKPADPSSKGDTKKQSNTIAKPSNEKQVAKSSPASRTNQQDVNNSTLLLEKIRNLDPNDSKSTAIAAAIGEKQRDAEQGLKQSAEELQETDEQIALQEAQLAALQKKRQKQETETKAKDERLRRINHGVEELAQKGIVVLPTVKESEQPKQSWSAWIAKCLIS